MIESWGYSTTTIELSDSSGDAEKSTHSGTDVELKEKEGFSEPFSTAISAEKVQPIREKIFKSRIHLLVNGACGVDGATHTLTIEEGMTLAKFSWWMETAKGWKPLEKISRKINSLCEEALSREIRFLG